jgi:hypothetical protein
MRARTGQILDRYGIWIDVGWNLFLLASAQIGGAFVLFIFPILPTAYVTETLHFAYCNEGRIVQ